MLAIYVGKSIVHANLPGDEMATRGYEVTMVPKQSADGQFGFSHIEIMPPVSRALARLICDNVVQHIDTLAPKDPEEEKPYPVVLDAFGFCDEGATVNTVLQFEYSFSIGETPTESEGYIADLRRTVERTLSPSGKAILGNDAS